MHKNRYFCKDCDTEDLEMFMLLDELWLSIAGKRDLLCFGCTEKRLGYSITIKHMKKTLILNDYILGVKLLTRALKNDDKDSLQFLLQI